MEFFSSAIETLQTLVIALGAGLAVWGVINLLEGYGNDNPGANVHVSYRSNGDGAKSGVFGPIAIAVNCIYRVTLVSQPFLRPPLQTAPQSCSEFQAADFCPCRGLYRDCRPRYA